MTRCTWIHRNCLKYLS